MRDKCPVCGATHHIDAQGGGGTAHVAPGQTVNRRQPARDPRLEHVATAAAYTSGSFTVFLVAGALMRVATDEPRWLTIGLVLALLAMIATWIGLVIGYQALLWIVEKATGRDIDRDGHTGRPPTTTPTIWKGSSDPRPDLANQFTSARTETPALLRRMESTDDGTAWIEIRPADARRTARLMRKFEIWLFVIRAFKAQNWTRDYWQNHGLRQKEWADLKHFLEAQNIWGCTDPPTLAGWLHDNGCPVTNEREPNERTALIS